MAVMDTWSYLMREAIRRHQTLISANHPNGRDGHVLVREQRLCDLVARTTARDEHAMLVRVLAMRPAKVTKLTT